MPVAPVVVAVASASTRPWPSTVALPPITAASVRLMPLTVTLLLIASTSPAVEVAVTALVVSAIPAIEALLPTVRPFSASATSPMSMPTALVRVPVAKARSVAPLPMVLAVVSRSASVRPRTP